MQQPSRGRYEFDRAELWADGVVHAAGVAFAVVGVAVLLVRLGADRPAADLLPVLVYGAALLTVLSISAAYNMWPVSPVKWRLRRFDHAAIYLLIAGTYTPFLVRLENDPTTWAVTGLVWAASLVGIALKLALPGRYDRAAIGLYLLIGWSGVALWDRVLVLPEPSLWLLAAGGLIYTAGVVFHVWESLRFQNAVWHAFVLVAAACHYAAVFHAALGPAGA